MKNKILCMVLGHIPVSEEKRDMFGYKYVWQTINCKRCDKQLN